MMNEPAFPSIPDQYLREELTKRELIAAMALQGILSSGKTLPPYDNAVNAVRLADALLEVLK